MTFKWSYLYHTVAQTRSVARGVGDLYTAVHIDTFRESRNSLLQPLVIPFISSANRHTTTAAA